MIVLDASVVIALLEPSDVHHGDAITLLDGADHDLLMHPLNLAEVLVGGARVGRGEELAEDLSAIGISITQVDDGEPLRLATLRASTGLRLPDCCVVDAALRIDAALATFDSRLAEIARQHHLRVVPGESTAQ